MVHAKKGNQVAIAFKHGCFLVLNACVTRSSCVYTCMKCVLKRADVFLTNLLRSPDAKLIFNIIESQAHISKCVSSSHITAARASPFICSILSQYSLMFGRYYQHVLNECFSLHSCRKKSNKKLATARIERLLTGYWKLVSKTCIVIT